MNDFAGEIRDLKVALELIESARARVSKLWQADRSYGTCLVRLKAAESGIRSGLRELGVDAQAANGKGPKVKARRGRDGKGPKVKARRGRDVNGKILEPLTLEGGKEIVKMLKAVWESIGSDIQAAADDAGERVTFRNVVEAVESGMDVYGNERVVAAYRGLSEREKDGIDREAFYGFPRR